VRGQSVTDILRDHWRRFGRHYYSRHDYEALDGAIANRMIEQLRQDVGSLTGKQIGNRLIQSADDFAYTDQIDGSVSVKQGIRLLFADGARIVVRLSGTGTEGATLRLYLESYQPDPAWQEQEPQHALAHLIDIAEHVIGIKRQSGRQQPDVIT
jgi:phosphoglucomutase